MGASMLRATRHPTATGPLEGPTARMAALEQEIYAMFPNLAERKHSPGTRLLAAPKLA